MMDSVISAGPLIRTWDGRYAKHLERILSSYRRLDESNGELLGLHHKATGERTSCCAGCSVCCQQWVAVWYMEALICVAEAERVGFEIDRRKLSEEVSELMKPEMTRRDWFGKHRPCTFLRSDGFCAIHYARPVACRAMLVFGDRGNCGSATRDVTRLDNRDVVHGIYRGMMVEHQRAGIGILASSMPVMVDLIITGGKPSDLTPLSGIFGLANERTRKRVSD